MAPGLCENCHKKPKFGAHPYCGKTCATEAASKAANGKATGRAKGAAPAKSNNICLHCKQKPKFSTFDYCGKRCAALAAGNVLGTQPPSHPSKGAQGPASKPKVPVPPPKGTRGPKVVIPANEESDEEYPEESESDYSDEDSSIDTDVYPSSDEDESPVSPALAPIPPTRGTTTKKAPQIPAKRVPGRCIVPGCGKSAFVDGNGAKSDYCSLKHREEAVTLGLVPGCIMCKRFPQSDANHFCSKGCRDQALTKV